MAPSRRAALALLAAAAVGAACTKGGPAPQAASGAGGGAGDGGKGPGLPTALGPGGDTRWLAVVGGPFADAAASAAPDASGGVLVAAAQGTGAPPAPPNLSLVRVAADGTASPRAFTSPCGVSGAVLGAGADGTAYLVAATACAAAVSGTSAAALPPSGAVLAVPAAGGPGAALPVTGPVLGGAVDAQGRLVALAEGGGAAVALAAGGGVAWRAALDGGRALAAVPAGAPGVGGVVVGTAPASGGALLLALAADGTERWRAALPAGFDLRHLAVLTDGAVAATGVLSAPASFGSGQGGAAGEQRQAVLAVEPGGAPRALAEIGDAAGGEPTVQVAPLPHGRALLFGFPGCERLRGLTPQLEPVWARTLDASCGATALGAALTTGGQVVVVGAFRGQADFGNGRAAAAQGGQDGFVLGLAP